MAEVTLTKLNKYFDTTHVVKDVDLTIRDKEFMVFVGPSGCGKTTTLRMIAGLEAVSSGDIRIENTVVNQVPPMDRDIAMVFQNYALYPHMSVASNMAFGLKMRKFPKEEIQSRIKRAATILGIETLLQRKAHVLRDRHLRVERVVLEHHGDVAILRRQVVDDPSADRDLAAGNIFESRDHAQQRRLATARRPDKNDEFAVRDFDIDAMDDIDGAVGLPDVLDGQSGHEILSLSQCFLRMRRA